MIVATDEELVRMLDRLNDQIEEAWKNHDLDAFEGASLRGNRIWDQMSPDLRWAYEAAMNEQAAMEAR